jgi:hypothetical protein
MPDHREGLCAVEGTIGGKPVMESAGVELTPVMKKRTCYF